MHHIYESFVVPHHNNDLFVIGWFIPLPLEAMKFRSVCLLPGGKIVNDIKGY